MSGPAISGNSAGEVAGLLVASHLRLLLHHGGDERLRPLVRRRLLLAPGRSRSSAASVQRGLGRAFVLAGLLGQRPVGDGDDRVRRLLESAQS
jgi:hypothetical protein